MTRHPKTTTMATEPGHNNPNSYDAVQPEQQVMSGPNAVTVTPAHRVSSTGEPRAEGAVPGPLDMDGETLAAADQQSATFSRQELVTGQMAQTLVNGTAGRLPEQEAVINSTQPVIVDTTTGDLGRSEQSSMLGSTGLLGGLQRVVQAVENVVQSGSRVATSPTQQDAVEYASVKSSISADVHPPSASTLPETPLFTEASMLRMRQMEASAPLLYARREFATTGPSSASSGDIQAEVRRQLAEFMSERDEEGRRLRAQVEALAYENSELRSRMYEDVQGRQVFSKSSSVPQSLPRFGWLRGLGNLIGSGPSFRSMDLRPHGVSESGFDLAFHSSTPMDYQASTRHAIASSSSNPQVPQLVHPGPHVPKVGSQVPTGHQVPQVGSVPTGPQLPQVGSQVLPTGHQVPQVGSQVLPTGHQVPQVGSQVLPTGHQVPQVGSQVPTGHQVPQVGSQVPTGHQVPQAASQVPTGHEVPQVGSQALPTGHQVPQVGSQVLPTGHQVPQVGPQVQPQVSAQVPQSGYQAPSSSDPQAHEAGCQGNGGFNEDTGVSLDPLSVVLTGMAQLQGLVTDLATSPKASQRTEVIKPGVTSLPDLPPLGGDACLAFSDWLHNAKPALGDVSDNSEELWNMVVSEATAWYNTYLRLDPLGRLTLKPDPSAELSQTRWQRLSRRIETMILQATPASVKEEISSARVSGLLPLMCKLFVVYGPGSLNEREIGLRNIQDPPAGTNIQDTIEHLRRWKRWCARMTELGGVLPDCALQVKAISKISRAALLQNPEISFRVSLSRASLQVDMNPDNDKVLKLHAQILSELEAVHHRVPKDKEADKERVKDSTAQAKIKGVEAGATTSPPIPKVPKQPKAPPKNFPPPKQMTSEGSNQRGPCTFYSQNNGCKKGADCAFAHNWAGFTPAEKALRCKLCGSKNHRAANCTAGLRADQDKGGSRTNPKNQATAKAISEVPPPPPKPTSQQHIKTMLADAARILQQALPEGQAAASEGQATVQAYPMSGPTVPPPSVNNNQPATPGTPVTLASLSAQLETLRGLTRDPEVKGVKIDSVEPAARAYGVSSVSLEVIAAQLEDLWRAVERGEGRVEAFQQSASSEEGLAKALALLDSGATHAVVPYSDSLGRLDSVPVTLAGDAKQNWWRTKGGTLVVPPSGGTSGDDNKPQTILPLGSLVESLGCTISWSRRKGLRVVHPTLGVLRTDISANHCPLVQEGQAMQIIAELEAKRLESFREKVQDLECQIESLEAPLDPTEALKRFAVSGDRRDALQAVIAQPYLVDLPNHLRVALAEGFEDHSQTEGKQLLKALPLKRAERRRLLQSEKWWVHLCSGPERPDDPIKEWCELRGIVPLYVDLRQKGGKGWDLTKRNGVWKLLLWAACTGRVAGILASPPSDLRGEKRVLGTQDMFLWSLASVATGRRIPFVSGHVDAQDEARQRFGRWSGMDPLVISQGALAGEFEHKTTIMTNLDLGYLGALPTKGKEGIPPEGRHWTKGFRLGIVGALSGKPIGVTCDSLDEVIRRSSVAPKDGMCVDFEDGEFAVKELSQRELDEWKAHVMRGHLPYRRDCRRCVEGSGLGVQHRGVKHKAMFTLSIDLFGPMAKHEKGQDEESVSANPHIRYGLVGAFRVPRSALEGIPKGQKDQEEAGPEGVGALPDDIDLEEYVPSEDEAVAGELQVRHESEFGFEEASADQIASTVRALECEEKQPSEECPLWSDDHLPEDERDQAEYFEDLSSPVDHAVLRYFVGLKSKSGPDVTAAIQQMVLEINKKFPVRILHSDPGTEFSSDKLKKWLAEQAIRQQHPLAADKQGNGLAERTIGWVKARARTLLGSSGVSASLWPTAMRWAVETHNRQILGEPPLPYFGQVVLHRLKRPPGGANEWMQKWVKARYLAPHLTVPAGHVLVTEDGNLVGSKGFRANTVDPEGLSELAMPVLQEEEGTEPLPSIDELAEGAEVPPIPDRRLRRKSSVQFVDGSQKEQLAPERLSAAFMLDDDYSDKAFKSVVNALREHGNPSNDRRGCFEGRFVFGAYSHGGNRGVVGMSRRFPETNKFLNRLLRRRASNGKSDTCPTWSAIMILQATEIDVHKDVRNEWHTKNYVLCIPGAFELQVFPEQGSRGLKGESLEPVSHSLANEVVEFDARKPHAVKRYPDWFLVGYTPLGTAKLGLQCHQLLQSLDFRYVSLETDEPTVCVVGAAEGSGTPPGRAEGSEQTSAHDLEQDLQPDSVTPIIGWDFSGGNPGEVPLVHLEEVDLHQFLLERGIPWAYRRLREIGVEEAIDLQFLYEEDLVENGFSVVVARRIMERVHPPNTRRPDNPELCALRTGEVQILDREQRPIPWAIQNRTLFDDGQELPLADLGIGVQVPTVGQATMSWIDREEERLFGTIGFQGQPSSSSDSTQLGFRGQPSLSGDSAQLGFQGQPSSSSDSTQLGFQGQPSLSGDSAQLGFQGQPSLSGDSAQLGFQGQPSSSSDSTQLGFQGQPSLSGDSAQLGFQGQPSSSGDSAQLGFQGQPSSSGDSMQLGSQGQYTLPCDPGQRGMNVSATVPKRCQGREHVSVQEEYASYALYMQSLWEEDEGNDDHEVHSDRGSSPEHFSCKMIRAPEEVPQSLRREESPQKDRTIQPVDLGPRIGVPITDPLAVLGNASEIEEPSIRQVDESFYTENVEELLTGLNGPLKVVHNVSPSEVKRHLMKWKEATEIEVAALEGMSAIRRLRGEEARNAQSQPGVQIIPAKPVFTVKPGGDKAWFRRKCRVVGCGNYETKDPSAELYAGGVPADVLRLCLVQAAVLKVRAWITDIKNAFLLASLPQSMKGKILLRPPKLLENMAITQPNEIWVIEKAVYGLRQSPKWWSTYRDGVLSSANWPGPNGEMRLMQSEVETNLWHLLDEFGTLRGYAIVYVDDIMVLASKEDAEAFYQWLRSTWQCTPLEGAQRGRPITFLGVEVREDEDELGNFGFVLSQSGYIEELIRSYNMNPVHRLVPFPKEWVKEFPPQEDYEPDVLRRAQKVTGEVLWVAQRSRPDVAYPVALMGSWCTRAPSLVAKLGMRLLEYLWTTKDDKLSLIPRDVPRRLTLYSDASFSPYGSASVTGVLVMFLGRVVLWKGKRQSIISLSTAESELIAACEAVVLGQSMQALVSTLGQGVGPMLLLVDNVAAIVLAEGGGSQRTRHLRVRGSFVKDLQDRQELEVQHCPGDIQLADGLTKILPSSRHQYLRELIGLVPVDGHQVRLVQDNGSSGLNAINQEIQVWLLLMLIIMQLPEAEAADDDDNTAEPLSLELSALALMMMMSALFIWESAKYCLQKCCRGEYPEVRMVRTDDDEGQRSRRQRRQDAVRRAIVQEASESELRQRREYDTPSSSSQQAPLIQVQVNTTESSPRNPPPLPRFPSSVGTRKPRDPEVLQESEDNHSRAELGDRQPTLSTYPLTSTTRTGRIVQDTPSLVPGFEGSRSDSVPRTREVSVQTDFPRGLTYQEMQALQVTTTNSRSPGAVHLFPECHKYCLNTAARSGI